MNNHLTLQQKAIEAAKTQSWSDARTLNETILVDNPEDIGALNRLGVAYLQLHENTLAKAMFEKALKIDKSNSIAKKHLQKIKQNQTVAAPSFSPIQFIEESGKSKIIELHRLAGKQALETLAVGKPCELKLKNRFISVDCNGVYIGALPEDLSFRLSKLVTQGNSYSCHIYSFSANSCAVFVRETNRAEACQDQPSFPLVKNYVAPINDIDEELLLDETGPVIEAESSNDEGETEIEEPAKEFDIRTEREE